MRISQLSIVAVALIAGLIGGALSGWILSPDKVLEVQTLRLVDKQGNPRGILSASNNHAGLVFMDKNGQNRIGIGLFPDGTSGLTLSDGAGTIRGLFSQSIVGSPMFSLRDSSDRLRLIMSSSPEASGLLIKGKIGSDMGWLGQRDHKPVTLHITDEKGDTVWSVP